MTARPPQPKKLFIKTYGCQMNVYDSERMRDVLGQVTSWNPRGRTRVYRSGNTADAGRAGRRRLHGGTGGASDARFRMRLRASR